METIVQFFKNSVEAKNFDFNLITVSALLTIILSTYQMWGVTKQIATIERKKSVESISIPLIIFAFFYLIATALYGVYTMKLSVIYNGTNFLFFSVVLIKVWRYKKINSSDAMFLLLFSLMIPIMVISTNKKLAYMSCASVMLLGMLSQLILLIRNKKSGALEPKLINVYIVTNSSWLIYGIITKDWVFQLSNAISVTIITLIAILLKRYKDR
ncbi:MAG: hypothetical protein NT165_00675 [Candidatus Falkowbacteria bacterium]|nr:hypothetical protein [Candidatus Falkowbacteria bacterium]